MTMTRRASAAAAAAAADSVEAVCGKRTAARRTPRTTAKSGRHAVGALAAVADVETRAHARKHSRETDEPGANTETGPAEENAAKRTSKRTRRSTATQHAADGAQRQVEEAECLTAQKDSAKEPAAKRSRASGPSGRKSKPKTPAVPAASPAPVNMTASTAAPVTADPCPMGAEREPQAVAGAEPPAMQETAAQASHRLELQGTHIPQEPTAVPPPNPPQQPRSPLGSRQLNPASPQRHSLATSAAISGCILPAATSAAAAAMPPAALGSPKQQPVAGPKPDSFEQELVPIRRLLMPGALAGTLVSCAAASASAVPAGPSAGSDAGATELAGRTAQFKELSSMVSECCSTGRGSAVYISGLPGTGKTYTVSRLLAALPGFANNSGDSGSVSFCCATVNCMAIDDPAKLYGRLQDELIRSAAADPGQASGLQADLLDACASTDAAAAYNSLLSTLHKLSAVQPGAWASGTGAAKPAKGKGAKRGRSDAAGKAAAVPEAPRRRIFVVVLDEVDRLLRRRDGGEELARLFQMPAVPGLSLVLLAVANSLDLTERMMPLLRARGLAPRHMVFTAYSRQQVVAILSAQLSSHPRGRRSFEDAALDMVAKSVSSSSGDLRQALKACRTALDVLIDHNRANPTAPRTSVGIREMHTALQRISSQGNGQTAMVAKIKSLPPQQQLVLLALATAVGVRAASAGSDAAVVNAGAGSFQPGGALFTGARPKFVDAVAFREINNQALASAAAPNPGACFDGPAAPTPAKAPRPGNAAPAATPTGSRVRGITGPGAAVGANTPSTSCSRGVGGPPSRTPGSILAGDAGLALGLADVYSQYTALCRQLDIPTMSESAFRTDALPGLDCDGLLRVTEGRTPAATRLSLRAMVRDVQAALADNVMFKRLMGVRPPAGPGPGAVGLAVRAKG